MQIDGFIRPAGGVVFTRDTWCSFIDKRPELRRPSAREGINPFTKKPVTFKPRDDAAEIVMNGKAVGSASWSMSEEALVNIRVDAAALPLVQQWAAELGGVFVQDAEG